MTSVAVEGTPVAVAPSVHRRSVGIVGMTFLSFVSTAAGPFGIESLVSSGGPWITFAFIAGVPLVVVLPMVLIVTELSSWMPSNHGYIRWTYRAWGPLIGFINAIFNVASNFVDLAVYPVMATNYLCKAFFNDASHGDKIAIQCAIIVAGTVPCLFNMKGVVAFCTVSSVLILIPFLVGFFGSVKHIDFAAWGGRVPADPDFSDLMSTGLWLYNGFIGNSCLAGEVQSFRVFLWGQIGALILDTLMYMLPLLVTMQINGAWGNAYLVTAFDHVFPGLGKFISLAGAASGYGLYLSSLTCYARTLWGTADLKWFPSIFARMHGGVPRINVLLLATTSIIFGAIGSFTFLINLEYTISALSYWLFAATFILLRYKEPYAPRKYVIPGGKFVAWLIVLPQFVFMMALFGTSLVDWKNAVGFIGTTVLTAALYYGVYRPFVAKGGEITDAQFEDPSDEDE